LSQASVPKSQEEQTDVVVDEVKNKAFKAQTGLKSGLSSVVLAID